MNATWPPPIRGRLLIDAETSQALLDCGQIGDEAEAVRRLAVAVSFQIACERKCSVGAVIAGWKGGRPIYAVGPKRRG